MADQAASNANECGNPNDSGGPYQVKLKGLPYESSAADVLQFLSDATISNGEGGVKLLIGQDGRPSGEALVVLETHSDMVKALNHDRQHMGSRYVEVMYVSPEQYANEVNAQTGSASPSDYIVRLRGLPYSAQVKDILCLLKDCKVKNEEKGVKFAFGVDGRPSGEAFVELCSADDVEKALAHSHEHMGRRYVEIFRANRSQLDWDCKKEERVTNAEGSGVVRLRGLPFGCSEEQIVTFFSGLTIVPGGIVFQHEMDGRETGEAFVELASKDDVDKALARDRNEIQHRYIEVFRSSHSEVKPYKGGRPTPYSRPGRGGGFQGYGTYGGGGAKYGSGYERNYRGGRGRGVGRGGGFGYGGDGGYYEDPGYFHGPPPQGPPHAPPHGEDPSLVAYPPIRQTQPSRGGYGGGAPSAGGGPPASRHSVRMRGLPYSAKEKDITDFFSPLVPLRLNMDYDQYGRPSGEAEIYFSSHQDASAAMQKNNQHIGHRYIELFLNSSGDAAPQAGTATTAGPQFVPPQQSWNGSRAQTAVGGAAGGAYGNYPGQPAYQQAPAQQYQQQSAAYAPSSVGYQPGYQAPADNTGYGQPAQTQQQWGTTY